MDGIEYEGGAGDAGSTDVDGAAGQIEALLKGSRGGDAGDKGAGKPAANGAAAGGSGNDGDDDDDQGEGGGGGSGDGDDGDGGAGGNDDAGGDQAGGGAEGADGDGLVDYEADGKVYRVPRALADGGLRQADYTRKTEALARDRDLVNARAQQVDVEQRTFAELAPLEAQMHNLRQLIARAAGERPDPTVDPMGYLSSDKHLSDLRSALANLEQSATERRNALSAQRQTADANLQAEFLKTLAREIPGWGHDANVAITKQLLSEGFTLQQVSDLRDPIIVKMAHKLVRLSKLEGARQTAKTKVAGAAPVVKPTGSNNRAGQSRSTVKVTADRAKATGNTRDAGAAILALMRAKRP